MEFLTLVINSDKLTGEKWHKFIKLMFAYSDVICIKDRVKTEPEPLANAETLLRGSREAKALLTYGEDSFVRFNERHHGMKIKMFLFNRAVRRFLDSYDSIREFEDEYDDLSFLAKGEVIFRSISHERMYDMDFHPLNIPCKKQLKILDEYGLSDIIDFMLVE